MPISPAATAISQLGAWASDQSRPLESRETFEKRFAEVQARFEGGAVPRPPHWGGYRLTPDRIEFWQDRAHRLHERRLFVRGKAPGDGWSEGLLVPVTEDQRRAIPYVVRAAIASVAMALFLLGLKGFAAWHTGSVAMLGSLGRYRARPACLARHALRRAPRRDAGRSRPPLRARQGRGAGRTVPGDADHRIGRRHRLARDPGVRRDQPDTRRRVRHRRVDDRDPRDAGAAALPAQHHPAHRIGRDHGGQYALPVRCAAQRVRDRRAGARPVFRLDAAPTRCSASSSPPGSPSARSARRTMRSTS